MRVVVVGGGILGLAAARLISHEGLASEVVVVEKEREIATHQTGHNSGVAHAGIYYAPGSLKARLCRRGRELLKQYCVDHGVGWDACGKLVIATGEHEVQASSASTSERERMASPVWRGSMAGS
jgi:(S)-2-hydroxyglutarate dehydrogenase